MLDLRDILTESQIDTLVEVLDVTGGNTTIKVTSDAGDPPPSQTIVLQNYDINAEGDLLADIIQAAPDDPIV